MITPLQLIQISRQILHQNLPLQNSCYLVQMHSSTHLFTKPVLIYMRVQLFVYVEEGVVVFHWGGEGSVAFGEFVEDLGEGFYVYLFVGFYCAEVFFVF